MKKKETLIITLAVLTVVAIIIGVIFLNKNLKLAHNNIEIIDATYSCNKTKEKIYEDESYIYYLPCQKSNSVFVKFKDTNSKVLLVTALNDGKVTMDELIKAKLEVIKEEK